MEQSHTPSLRRAVPSFPHGLRSLTSSSPPLRLRSVARVVVIINCAGRPSGQWTPPPLHHLVLSRAAGCRNVSLTDGRDGSGGRAGGRWVAGLGARLEMRGDEFVVCSFLCCRVNGQKSNCLPAGFVVPSFGPVLAESRFPFSHSFSLPRLALLLVA
jgi:hypothetical protein